MKPIIIMDEHNRMELPMVDGKFNWDTIIKHMEARIRSKEEVILKC